MTPEKEALLLRVKVELAATLRAICDQHQLSKPDLLALLAYMTGAAIAHQDQRTMTPTMALKIVSDNIEAGNQAAQERVMLAGGVAQ